MTASRKTLPGRPRFAGSRPTRSSRSLAGLQVDARWSPVRNRCSAPSMASSRCGWAWYWPPCSANRSAGRRLAYALGSTSNTGKPAPAVPVPTLPRAATALPISSRWRACRTCCCIRASLTTTGSGSLTPRSGWSIGRAAIRSIIIRIQRLPRLGPPDIVVVHESAWTASARHADVVLPATITLERRIRCCRGRSSAGGDASGGRTMARP